MAADPGGGQAVVRLVRPGAVLYWEGDEADHVFQIMEGAVRTAAITPDGERRVTGFFFAGDSLGFGPRGIHAASAQVITRARILMAPWDARQATPDAGRTIAERAAMTEWSACQERGRLLSIKDSRLRLLAFVEAMGQQQGVKPGEPIWLPMTRTDMADYLGLALATVSRLFTRQVADRVLKAAGPRRWILGTPGRVMPKPAPGGDAAAT
jgi:CRP/FNR family transcriptional regulator